MHYVHWLYADCVLALVLLMEYLVSWASQYLDTRHLYEMTRSRDPRDLVSGCVQLQITSMGFR